MFLNRWSNDPFMEEVYVVEVVPTGPTMFPRDRVVEVAICRVLPNGLDFDSVLADRISMDPRELGKTSLDYLESFHGLTPQDLYFGTTEEELVSRVRSILCGRTCTSFDIQQSFGKFLCFEPWNLTHEADLLPSIKSRFHPDLRVMEQPGNPIRSLYEKVLPGDPASVGEGNGAYECACMSSSLLIHLRETGYF